jgi:hypothetical protein
VSTKKSPDFGDVLKIDKNYFSGVNDLRTTRVQIPAYVLDCLTVHRCGAPTVLT